MRAALAWLLLASCGPSLLTFDYPAVPGFSGTEIIGIVQDGEARAYALDYGAPFRFPERLDDGSARITALLYQGSLEENGLSEGLLQPAAEAPRVPMPFVAAFSLEISGGDVRTWTPLRGVDPALERYQLAALPVASIASGLADEHTCLVYDDDSARCFGTDRLGEIAGDGTGLLEPPAEPLLEGVAQLSTGSSHTCALSRAGRVACFGRNDQGQLARDTLDAPGRTPEVIADLRNVVQIEGGREWTCALDASGRVACFGFGGDADPRGEALAPIAFPAPVEKIGVSAFTVCGLSDGRLYCTGANVCAVLADTTTRAFDQVEIRLPGRVVDLGGGDVTFCALLESSALYCWGCNGAGMVDVREPDPVLTPVAVLDDVERFDLGAIVSCAIRRGGETWCWGADNHGQLGDGPPPVDRKLPPARVVGLDDAVEIQAYDDHACARTAAGRAFCWGEGNAGQLGNGTLSDRVEPTPVSVVRATRR